jgi:two-component system, response regulator PdtaR
MLRDPRQNGQRTPTVLVVEDEFLIAEAVAEVLGRLGLNVLLASSADDALRQLDQRRDVALVFSDIRMPGTLDGLELARRVSHSARQLPVVLTSANEVSPRDLNGFPFVRKPYRDADIARLVLAQLGLEQGEWLKP